MPPEDLDRRVRDAARGLDGRVGVHLRHLATGQEVSIDADDLFPAACVIKVPIMLALLERVSHGELDWDSKLTVTTDRAYGLDQIVDRLKLGSRIELAELVYLMISLSDVGAGLWCQELAGGGEAVNAWLAMREYAVTRVNSRTPGREDDLERWGWGQTSPREASGLLESVRRRTAVSPEADAYADRMLGSSFFVQDSMAALPTDVPVLTKTGAVDASRSEVLLVGSGPDTFVCCVMTDGLADTSWGLDNAGHRLQREILGLAWAAWGTPVLTSPPGPWPWVTRPRADAPAGSGRA